MYQKLQKPIKRESFISLFQVFLILQLVRSTQQPSFLVRIERSVNFNWKVCQHHTITQYGSFKTIQARLDYSMLSIKLLEFHF